MLNAVIGLFTRKCSPGKVNIHRYALYRFRMLGIAKKVGKKWMNVHI